jgi:hypothetical protein
MRLRQWQARLQLTPGERRRWVCCCGSGSSHLGDPGPFDFDTRHEIELIKVPDGEAFHCVRNRRVFCAALEFENIAAWHYAVLAQFIESASCPVDDTARSAARTVSQRTNCGALMDGHDNATFA